MGSHLFQGSVLTERRRNGFSRADGLKSFNADSRDKPEAEWLNPILSLGGGLCVCRIGKERSEVTTSG